MKRPNPTTVRFKEDQLERLKVLSKEDNCAVNYLIKKAVDELLIKRGK